jgi:hypothetical protein
MPLSADAILNLLSSIPTLYGNVRDELKNKDIG